MIGLSAADPQGIASLFPRSAAVRMIGIESVIPDTKPDLLLLSGLEKYTAQSAEMPAGLRIVAAVPADISLHHFPAGHASRIHHSDCRF